jgi:hypothetical protein
MKKILIGIIVFTSLFVFFRTFGFDGVKKMYSTGKQTVQEIKSVYQKVDSVLGE